jgi:hypothetical protein
MKSVGRPEGSLPQAQEKVLRTTMHVTRELDALVHASVEASKNGVLHAARDLLREVAFAQTAGQRGDDLGHRQIGHEKVLPSLHCPVELVAAGLGQVELEESAGVAIDGARQRDPVPGAPLA